MIEVADLGVLSRDPVQKEKRKTWLVILSAAFLGGLSGALLAVLIAQWLFIPWMG